ncbi:hypothetical protein, partial [Streptomyces sp. NPDC088766]|uniref:hypothetical protein n=1 Tax=Streptomyces sp. NPDC088766 TaxID=3365893 RepID=UPI00382EF35B
SGTRSARTPDTLPTKIAKRKNRSSTHSETISKSASVPPPSAPDRYGPLRTAKIENYLNPL